MNKKLYKDEYHKMIGGVCAGLGEYFDIDVTIVRLVFVCAAFAGGVSVIPYIILWIVLPKKGYLFNNFNDPTVDYTVPPQQQPGDFATPPPFTDSNFQYSRYGSDPFTKAEFKQPGSSFVPPKKRSNAGVIIGMILIIIGAMILIDNFNLIPDFDFWRLSPVVLVVIGAAIIISGQKKQSLDNAEWDNKTAAGTAENSEAKTTDVPPASEL